HIRNIHVWRWYIKRCYFCYISILINNILMIRNWIVFICNNFVRFILCHANRAASMYDKKFFLVFIPPIYKIHMYDKILFIYQQERLFKMKPINIVLQARAAA